VLFERGRFSAADALVVGGVQRLYVLAIPFFAVGMLFSRFLAAAHRTDLLLLGNVGLLLTNIVLDALLVRWLGVGGIALATSLVYALAAVLLFAMCRHVERAAAGEG
jgi:putative peptidoglycan lipid II flippase